MSFSLHFTTHHTNVTSYFLKQIDDFNIINIELTKTFLSKALW